MELKITPVDKTAEEDGVWADYRGVKLKIARANNERYTREFRRLTRPYQKQIAKNKLDPDLAKEILAKAAAKGLLRDWKDFYINGEKVPFSLENATQLLLNDEDCLDFVTEFAQDMDNYVVEEMEELAKES